MITGAAVVESPQSPDCEGERDGLQCPSAANSSFSRADPVDAKRTEQDRLFVPPPSRRFGCPTGLSLEVRELPASGRS